MQFANSPSIVKRCDCNHAKAVCSAVSAISHSTCNEHGKQCKAQWAR